MARPVAACLLLMLAWSVALPPAAVIAGEDEAAIAQERASDEDVAMALAQFKVDYKAKGLVGDDKLSQRDWAMRKLSRLQHPEVIKALAKISKSRGEDLRSLAIIYLGDQALFPRLAATPILAAMKRNRGDALLQVTCLQALSSLKYLGARKQLASLLKHKDLVVRKVAVAAIGDIKDIRLLKELLLAVGIVIDPNPNTGTEEGKQAPGGGGEAKTYDEGYSWDEVEVFVPEGEDPAAAVKAAQEKAKAEARAEAQKRSGGASANSSGSGGADGAGGGRGYQSRSALELLPMVLRTLMQLTGERFKSPGQLKKWLAENAKLVRETKKSLDKTEKAQKAAK